MSKTANCVVGTESRKDRKRLIDFLSKKGKYVSLIDDYNGFQLILITEDHGIGYIGVICAENLVNKHGFTMFPSVKDFINTYEE